MQCSDIVNELSALKSGELSAELAQEVRQHLSVCPVCRQAWDEIGAIEQRLEAEPANWREPGPGFTPVTLDGLRQRAALLSQAQADVLCRGVAALEPQDAVGRQAHHTGLNAKWWYRWRRQLVATAAACLIMILFLPQVIMASIDLPGVGPLIQRVVLQYAGLSWAYDNGYIQGTVAQVSKDGVTLRVLGIVADPIQTAVIYLVQGVEAPKPAPEKPTPASRVDQTDPIPAVGSGFTVTVARLDGEGTWSSSDRPLWTQLGYVGVLQTAPLPAADGTLEVELRLPGKDKTPLGLILPVTREAVSKLAQELPIDFAQTVDGITVAGKRMVLTPALVMVEYTIQGGHVVYGETPPEMSISLESSGEPTANSGVGGYGSGTLVDGVWHSRAIFTRPTSMDNLRLSIPWLAKDLPVNLSWPLEQSDGKLVALGIPVQVASRLEGDGKVTVELSWSLNDRFGNLSGLEILDADGRVLERSLRESGTYTLEETRHERYSYQFSAQSQPTTLRITTAEQNVNGQWVIPIPTSSAGSARTP